MKEEKIATWMGIIGNSLLFFGKIIVGLMYNSIAIISDALNSFTDIIASLIIHISVIVSYKKEDKEHQFGHERAQPIAGLIVAIFTGIVGFEIIAASIRRLILGGEIEKGFFPIFLILGVLIIKAVMYFYTEGVCKISNSAALKAACVDHKNDMLVSIAVLVGIIASNFGYPIFDPIVAILIGFYIIKSGYGIGMDNIRFLMGEAPSEELFSKISSIAKSVKGVIGLNDVRAHYVGTLVEAEVHIYVNKKMSILKAHDIGNKVEAKLERMDEISKAFIHIDPFKGRFVRERRF